MPPIKIPNSISIPPISPYGTFTGELFQYSRNLVAFESVPPTPSPSSSSSSASQQQFLLPKCKCILIGGLSDGLVPTPYTKQLEEACHSLTTTDDESQKSRPSSSWSLIQPILSSSYLGFGNGNLDRDSNEIT